jgi:copper chaperone NosL
MVKKQEKSMNTFSLILFTTVISLFACSHQPKPIQYGRDACDFCKMTIMDKRFASEIMTKKGKPYKFDDLLCTVNFLNEGKVASDDIACVYVTNFDNSEFVNVSEAYFFKYEKYRSPMGGNVAAFKTREQLESAQMKLNGEVFNSWEKVREFFKPE